MLIYCSSEPREHPSFEHRAEANVAFAAYDSVKFCDVTKDVLTFRWQSSSSRIGPKHPMSPLLPLTHSLPLDIWPMPQEAEHDDHGVQAPQVTHG